MTPLSIKSRQQHLCFQPIPCKLFTGIVFKLFLKSDHSLCFVSSTTEPLKRRWKRIQTRARKGDWNHLSLYQALKQQGVENFAVEALGTYSCETKEDLKKYERQWIRKLNPSLNVYKKLRVCLRCKKAFTTTRSRKRHMRLCGQETSESN